MFDKNIVLSKYLKEFLNVLHNILKQRSFIRRTVITNAERKKQVTDTRHLLHGHTAAQKRLPSRRSFLDTSEALETSPDIARTTKWLEQLNNLENQAARWRDRGIVPEECLATGQDQPWAVWKTLNRL